MERILPLSIRKNTVNYVGKLNSTLVPTTDGAPLVVDLFAGCGGLSLGFRAAGFATIGFEMLNDCVDTYRKNVGPCKHVVLNETTPLPAAQVVIGGPPCQPFSVNGKQLGADDTRDGFRIFISAIERIQPEVWIFENVPGVFYRNSDYFESVIDELKLLDYFVETEVLNAAQFGVPQNRERIFVVGHRRSFYFPKTKSTVVTVGDALPTAKRTPRGSEFLTKSMDRYIARYEKASCCVKPRDLRLNEPARTLTCRNLGGATGDMLRLKVSQGRRRRLLVSEAALLQSFPEWFRFSGSKLSQFNQIGNAVPPLLSYAIAKQVRRYLNGRSLTREEVRFLLDSELRTRA